MKGMSWGSKGSFQIKHTAESYIYTCADFGNGRVGYESISNLEVEDVEIIKVCSC